jgi:hypothetical protein
MIAFPTPEKLEHLGDLELRSLAVSWRMLASYGHRGAGNVLVAIQAEQQRRLDAQPDAAGGVT